MALVVDVFGRSLPLWVQRCVAGSSAHTVVECISAAQRLQLGLRFDAYGSSLHVSPTYRFLLVRSPVDSEVSRVCLSHTRPCRRVSLRCGDVTCTLDRGCDHLSCRGVPLTDNEDALQQLSRVASQQGYRLPFWVSLEEAVQLPPASRWQRGATAALGASQWVDKRLLVEVVNDRNTACSVCNVEELHRAFPACLARDAQLFSYCRKFRPVNILTKRAFDPVVEDRLRRECHRTGCWCSLWGTPDDFAAAGVGALRGALGLHVFDKGGNELFLTNAFCTEDPIAAFAVAYPNETVFETF